MLYYRDVKDGEGHNVRLAHSRLPTVGQAAHIARHGPVRILRQCQAAKPPRLLCFPNASKLLVRVSLRPTGWLVPDW